MGNRITQSQTHLNREDGQKRSVFKNRIPAKPGHTSTLSSPNLRNSLLQSKYAKYVCEGDADYSPPYAFAFDELCQIAANQKDHISSGWENAWLKKRDSVKLNQKVKWIHRFHRKRDKCQNIENHGFVLNESSAMSIQNNSYQHRSDAVSEKTSSLPKLNYLCHKSSVASTSSGDCSIDTTNRTGQYPPKPQQYSEMTTDSNHRLSRSVSTGVSSKSEPTQQHYPRNCQSSHGDCVDNPASPNGSWLGFKAQGDVKRCYSAFTQDEDLRSSSRASRALNSRLGVFTYPDGRVQYTAFLRAGGLGIHTHNWLSDIRRKAARALAGLQRQYKCKIDIGDELISYRGCKVHSLVIRGQNQTEIIRCKNALPACLERQLITSHAVYGTGVRIGH